VIGIAIFQSLLYGIGSILAFFYRLIPNYGIAIILLTLAMRVLLLPLGLKQIRSMQSMQAIQPQVKAIQQKYKGNRQKINEETMKLYRERGVNPLSGCLPLLLQFPLLIALFAVLRVPGGLVHIPQDSSLHTAIVNQDTSFLGVNDNLLCSAVEAGREVPITYPKGWPPEDKFTSPTLHCGHGFPVRIPYYVLAGLMVLTTYYQQRQMQRASPSTVNQQQQMITRFMPILFGVWGFIFPMGLVVYWTTTNLVQIGQQHFMLQRGGKGQEEPARKAPGKGPSGDGGRGGQPGGTGRPGGAVRRGPSRGSGRTTGRSGTGSGVPRRGTAGRGAGDDGQGVGRKPELGPGGGRRRGPLPPRSGGSGGGGGSSGARDAGDRKKRRKR